MPVPETGAAVNGTAECAAERVGGATPVREKMGTVEMASAAGSIPRPAGRGNAMSQ